MALKHKSSGFKVEHAIIVVLLTALITVILYFAVFNKPNQTTALEQQPVASAIETTSSAPASVDQSPMQPVRYGMAVGQYQGEIHPIVDILNDLKGFKYDKSVAPVDTVYIVYDPRCPYCHSLFDKIKNVDLKAKKITIKWLPTLALGIDDHAKKLAAIGVKTDSMEEFESTFNDNVDTSNVTVSEDIDDALNENMGFLFEASNQTYGESHPKAVPAVFFIDKETGAPNMMYGASEDEVFKQIFGE